MGFFGLFGGFNPSKCKTALRLCIGRIKLLKNKKGLAARALRKEIADLLGADKTESARVRIEGVRVRRRSEGAAFVHGRAAVRTSSQLAASASLCPFLQNSRS